jgi:hypothetical protein
LAISSLQPHNKATHSHHRHSSHHHHYFFYFVLSSFIYQFHHVQIPTASLSLVADLALPASPPSSRCRELTETKMNSNNFISPPSIENVEPKREALISAPDVDALPSSYPTINEDYPLPSQSVSFDASTTNRPTLTLTSHEVLQLRRLLNNNNFHSLQNSATLRSSSSYHSLGADSEYSEFPQTTHAWAVFADNPLRKATKTDRIIGTFIMAFQMFTYFLFANEAMEDYQRGAVRVLVSHKTCQESGEEPVDNFVCEADETNNLDAVASFVMLSVFLTPEILGALRAIRNAYNNPELGNTTLIFACLAAIEVVSAFLAAAIAISYQLYIGEVTDAIEAGVGLLFVRELSARAYSGIRHKGVKQYRSFGLMLVCLVGVGFLVEACCEAYATRVLREQHN